MKTQIFDGKAYAKKKEEELAKKVQNLPSGMEVPKLASIIVGEDPASLLYVNLKKKAAERVGLKVDIITLEPSLNAIEIRKKIEFLNNDPETSGIMIQLPLPKNYSKDDRDMLLNSISPGKDVDGLRDESEFIAPTAKAVTEVLLEALKVTNFDKRTLGVLIVGASGFEGKQIIKALQKDEMLNNERVIQIIEANSKTENLSSLVQSADVVISVTGIADLIKREMVGEGAILIDVGAPKGDIAKDAYEKAAFVSPVPGGVGPITISCLLENLMNSVKS